MEKVNHIDKGNYEGYLWYSNRKEPQVLCNEDFECELDANVNPFIVEAQLYDASAHVSYSVKYVDGAYIACRYDNVGPDVSAADSSVELEKRTYCANRMGGRNLVFMQWWREQPDALCENMKVLQPAELVFVGFKKEGGK